GRHRGQGARVASSRRDRRGVLPLPAGRDLEVDRRPREASVTKQTEPTPRPPTPAGQVIPPGGILVPQGAPVFTHSAPLAPITAKPTATPTGPPPRIKPVIAKGRPK